MSSYRVPIWKQSPCIRLLAFLVTGVILQFYVGFHIEWLCAATLLSTLFLIVIVLLPVSTRYRFQTCTGIVLAFLMMILGAVLTWKQDVHNQSRWFGQHLKTGAFIIHIDEPPLERPATYKMTCSVIAIIQRDSLISCTGKFILYFKKDSLHRPPAYGEQFIVANKMQSIPSPANPGGFNYKQYMFLQGITQQLFLNGNEMQLLRDKKTNLLDRFIYASRDWVLKILRANINGSKEAGLAEALLIGYRNDLDKQLVQSYSNTGVVHIIAISGLHLGLIYALLVALCRPLHRSLRGRWFSPVIVITGLWVFTLLAGAQPSVLRSAIMFSCIALGQAITRRSSIYNSLAFSALLLLCYDPFWLWDVGFQLSYAAVVSIVMFNRPVYCLLGFSNKWMDRIWKLNAVTLSAQLLTVPLCLYHFHQFPVYFLLSNFVAVPLSSFILLAEIALCCIFFVPPLAFYTGKFISMLIWLMNSYVEWIEELPGAMIDGIRLSLLSAILLSLSILILASWRRNYSPKILMSGLSAMLACCCLQLGAGIRAKQQYSLIVYSVTSQTAIEIFQGESSTLLGDSNVIMDPLLQRNYFYPARTIAGIKNLQPSLVLKTGANFYVVGGKRMVILNSPVTFQPASPLNVDLLILSHNPRIYLSQLLQVIRPGMIVFDGSVPPSRLRYWKKDCDSLRIPYYDVRAQGAFALNLNKL